MDPILHTDVHRLEEALGIKIYPGTEVLKDVAGVEFVKSKEGVLVPQPSNDAADPLNWNTFWKFGALSGTILLGFMQGFGPLSLSSQVPYYIQDFDATVEEVINFIGVSILVLGFSNFLWVPVATQFGRRPCALLSNLVCLGSMIWRARAQTKQSFLGACVLNGIGAGPAETLPPMVIADVVFLDHRGFWMAAYWYGYFGSLMVGPVAAGAISERWGWRSFWWLNVALFGFLIVYQFFLNPETKFDRSESAGSVVTDKDSATAKELGEHDEIIVEKHVDDKLGRGRPNKAQMAPILLPKFNKKSLMNDLITPWYLFLLPGVQWSSFVVSWSASCFLCLNLTQSLVFAAPPYNFSPSAVGYTNFGVLGGATIGLLTAGPLGDWVSAYLTRRNGMVREPEMRLPALWPYVIILAIGTAVAATGYDKQWSWQTIVVVGYGFIGCQVAALPALAISYSVDSYTRVSGEFLVTMTVNKNLWGYGVSQFLVPWIMTSGKPNYRTPMLVNTGLTIAFALLGSIVLFKFGKTMRGWTKNSYIHRM